METNIHTITASTNELLAKLNNVMNQSNLVREIVDKSEALWNLEQSIGYSTETQNLRNEIARLEDLLRIIRQ
ncbi:MAG: hypothetical protein GY806_13185 [Gammaproteobacteria bacterium]|nr:hypothetical protein [Gammaproteobacteria bacterium]